MARILCLTTGLTGILYASFELMRRLEQEGHTVICGTHSLVGEDVETQGFDYVQLPIYKADYASDVPSDAGKFKKIRRLLYKLINGPARCEAALRALEIDMEEYRSILKTVSPDLVIINIELHPFIFTTYQQNIPFCLLSQFFNGLEDVGLPPLESKFIPSKESSDAGAIANLWQQQTKTLKQRHWKTQLSNFFSDRRSVLLAYARKVGFPTSSLSQYGWPPPFNYRDFPTLHCQLEELEFPHDSPPNHHYIGMMVCEDRKALKKAPNIQEQLDKLIQLRETQQKKLVYLTCTTMHQEETIFIQKFAEAVATRPDWIGVISLGGQTDIALEKVPENVHLFPYLPQLQVLCHCDCSVNHAGLHTIHECISFHIPMVIYSGENFDQNGCAARMKYHGLAVLGDRAEDTPVEIQQKISQAMSRSDIKENLQRFSALNTSSRYQNRLPQLINEILNS